MPIRSQSYAPNFRRIRRWSLTELVDHSDELKIALGPLLQTDFQPAIESVEKSSADTSEPKNSTKFTMADIDKIRNHVATCWSPPISLTGANQRIVDINVTLDSNGKVLGAEVDGKTKALIATDRKHRVIADEAIRTVFKCSPFPEPENGFGEQTNFVFGFDPRFLN